MFHINANPRNGVAFCIRLSIPRASGQVYVGYHTDPFVTEVIKDREKIRNYGVEMEAEMKHLEDERLANGVVVRFYDESRMVAGDRWQVTVRYEAVVPVSETFWSLVSGEPELIEEIRAALGAEMVLTNINERNFISAEEKEALVAEIISRARKNIFGYLADPGFPERYFKRCFKEAREVIERKKREVRVLDNAGIEEPVDFSHLFSDVKKSE